MRAAPRSLIKVDSPAHREVQDYPPSVPVSRFWVANGMIDGPLTSQSCGPGGSDDPFAALALTSPRVSAPGRQARVFIPC